MKIIDSRYLKILPFLGAFLILVGIVNCLAYYNYFELPINEYLTFSETIILFSQEIRTVVIIILINSAIVYTYGFQITKNGSVALLEYKKQPKLFKRLFYFSKISPLIYITIFIITTLTLFIFKTGFLKELFDDAFYFLIGMFFFMFLITEYEKKMLEKNDAINEFIKMNLLLVTLTLSLSWLNGRNEARIKYYLLPKFNYEIWFNDGAKVKTNNNLIFIGQTESTLFLYEKCGKAIFIYNRNAINKIIKRKFNE